VESIIKSISNLAVLHLLDHHNWSILYQVNTL